MRAKEVSSTRWVRSLNVNLTIPCHVINIRGNSYRMREHSELWQALHPAGSDEPRPPANARKKSPEVPAS